jgi:hypothetical protein
MLLSNFDEFNVLLRKSPASGIMVLYGSNFSASLLFELLNASIEYVLLPRPKRMSG